MKSTYFILFYTEFKSKTDRPLTKKVGWKYRQNLKYSIFNKPDARCFYSKF